MSNFKDTLDFGILHENLINTRYKDLLGLRWHTDCELNPEPVSVYEVVPESIKNEYVHGWVGYDNDDLIYKAIFFNENKVPDFFSIKLDAFLDAKTNLSCLKLQDLQWYWKVSEMTGKPVYIEYNSKYYIDAADMKKYHGIWQPPLPKSKGRKHAFWIDGSKSKFVKKIRKPIDDLLTLVRA